MYPEMNVFQTAHCFSSVLQSYKRHWYDIIFPIYGFIFVKSKNYTSKTVHLLLEFYSSVAVGDFRDGELPLWKIALR